MKSKCVKKGKGAKKMEVVKMLEDRLERLHCQRMKTRRRFKETWLIETKVRSAWKQRSKGKDRREVVRSIVAGTFRSRGDPCVRIQAVV